MTGVVRRSYFARRNPAVAPDDFAAVWRGHSDLLQTMPKLAERFTAYAYCLVDRDFGADVGLGNLDGIGTFWLASSYPALDDDARQRRFAQADPAGSQRMLSDERRVFAAPVRTCALTAEEAVVRDAPVGTACVFVLTSRSDNDADAGNRLRQVVAEFAAQKQHSVLGRVAVNRVMQATAPVAAVAELWMAPGGSRREFEALTETIGNRLTLSGDGSGCSAYLTTLCHSHGLP